MSAGPATAHRPSVRRPPAPRAPRRVSGPTRARTPRGAVAAPPRRVAANAGAVALPQPLAPRVVEALRGLPESVWLDRLLRGRAWILIIGIALMGLVFMQVSMLEMNAGIGQSVERAGTLERQNADLRATVSQLSSEERIQREALEMGLLMPGAGDVRYLSSRGANVDARQAAKIMRAPSATAEQQTAAAAAQAAAGITVDPATAAATATAPEPTPVTPAAAEAQQTTPAAEPVTPVAQQPTPQPAPQAQAAPAQPQAQPVAPQAATAGATAAPGTGQ